MKLHREGCIREQWHARFPEQRGKEKKKKREEKRKKERKMSRVKKEKRKKHHESLRGRGGWA